MSFKLGTLGLLKGHDVISFFHDVTNKVSGDSNYIVDAVM